MHQWHYGCTTKFMKMAQLSYLQNRLNFVQIGRYIPTLHWTPIPSTMLHSRQRAWRLGGLKKLKKIWGIDLENFQHVETKIIR